MLKLWFPQVTAQVSVTPNPADLSPQNISTHGSSNITPPQKHKDQLHIPVKVRDTQETPSIIFFALHFILCDFVDINSHFILSWLFQKRSMSWSDTDSPSSSPPMVCKSSKLEFCEEQHQWPYVDGGEGSSKTPPLFSNKNKSDKKSSETLEHNVIRWSGSRLTWVHIAPIFSPPTSGPSHKGEITKERGSRNALLTISPLKSRSSPAMQDSFVSSTTSFSEPTRYQCNL